MKIAIDISQTVYGTGVSVYTLNLVENLIKLYPDDEFFLFGGSLRRRVELVHLVKKLKSTAKILPFPPTILDFLWNSLHIFPVEKFIGQFDIVHTSDWTEPPSNLPKITTVHDLVPFKYPQTTTESIRQTHKKRLAWVARESDLIIAVSHATKDDLVSILKIPEEKIVVIHEGVSPRFCPQPLEIVDSIKRKYHLQKDYLLSLSTLEPRKNQNNLIKAFNLVKKEYPNLELVIGGKTGWGEQIKPQDDVKLLGFVPDADLPALISGASSFVFPSLYEGFGLPALEAMACGIPVVASDISSLPEVVGEAGELVDPNTISDIATGIIKTLKKPAEYREKSLVQAKKFTWQETAQKTYEAYKVAIENHQKNK